MGKLEDIVERNQRAPRSIPSMKQLFIGEVQEIFDRRTPMHVRKRKALAMGITLAVVAGLVAWLLVARHDRQVAKRTAVTDASGARASLAELWRERPALIVFYSMFACEGCEAQLRDAQALAREHRLAVAAVAFDRNGLELVRAALGPELPLYVAGHELIEAWGIPWQWSDKTGPAIFLVAPGGDVTFRRTCKDFVHCSIRGELAPAFSSPGTPAR